MRNFATYRVFFASAISVLILLAASCIRNEKVVPEYQDKGGLSLLPKLFDDGIDHLRGNTKAKDDTDSDINQNDDVNAHAELHENLIETLDVFVKEESAAESAAWVYVHHFSQDDDGAILDSNEPGGLLEKAKHLINKSWTNVPSAANPFDPDVEYHIYVTANNPHTHSCQHTDAQHYSYRRELSTPPANLAELKALSTYDATIGFDNLAKYYTSGVIENRANSTNTKAFLMDGDTIWSPHPETGEQVWDIDLKRAVSKVMMNLSLDPTFKADSLDSKHWHPGKPMWRYVNFGFEVADIADGTYELNTETAGNPWTNDPLKVGSLSITDGTSDPWLYHIKTYTAPFKWDANDYHIKPYILVSIVYTYFNEDDETDPENWHDRTCYYHIPICNESQIGSEGLKRNNIYIVDAAIASWGSANEDIEPSDFEVRIEYHVVPWTETDVNSESTVVKLSDIKYLTVYPQKYSLSGDGSRSVELNWYASVSTDDGIFPTIDLSSVNIHYTNASGTDVSIKGDSTTFENAGEANYIYKRPMPYDGTTNLAITSKAKAYSSSDKSANSETVVIELTPKGIIRVTSEALSSRAVKIIEFDVKLNNSTLPKKHVVIRHYPTDNIQSFTGSWSSRWDGNPYAYSVTYYSYDVTKYYRKGYYKGSEGWKEITQAEWATGIGSSNDDRRNANGQSNAINGYYATGGSQTTVTNTSTTYYSGTIPSSNVTYSWYGNVLTVSGTGGGGGGGGSQARSYTVTGFDYYVGDGQSLGGQPGNRTVSIDMWKYSTYYKWGSSREYSYDPDGDGWGSNYDGWEWVECTEAQYNATSSDSRKVETSTVETDYLPSGITEYTTRTETVDGQASTGNWVDWENHTGTTTSEGIFTAKVFYNGQCYPITSTYEYGSSSTYSNLKNNHMYVIQITAASSSYVLGNPILDSNYQSDDHVVAPAFMIASQLGAVQRTTSATTAATHCGTYMEVGTDGTRYTGWRLPTKEEIDVIIEYQSGTYTQGVTMAEVLGGQYYWTLDGNTAYVSTGSEGTTANAYVRCVRTLSGKEIQALNGD